MIGATLLLCANEISSLFSSPNPDLGVLESAKYVDTGLSSIGYVMARALKFLSHVYLRSSDCALTRFSMRLRTSSTLDDNVDSNVAPKCMLYATAVSILLTN